MAFVDFNKGDTEVLLTGAWNLLLLINSHFLYPQGYVRFDEEDGAKKAVEEMETMKSKLCGAEVQLRVLEGEEEEGYWSKMALQAQSRGKKRQAIGRGSSRKRGPAKRGLKNGEKASPPEKLPKPDDSNGDS